MERFVIIVNGWKPLSIITKRSILDIAAALDPPLWSAKSRQTTDQEKRLFAQAGNITGWYWKQIILLFTCSQIYLLALLLCSPLRIFRVDQSRWVLSFPRLMTLHVSWNRVCCFCKLTYFVEIYIVRKCSCFGHSFFLTYCFFATHQITTPEKYLFLSFVFHFNRENFCKRKTTQ